MSQASIVLANTSRSAYRAAHNAANAAIASHHAGPTPPPNPALGWIWHNTDTDSYLRRNLANTAWVPLTQATAVLDEDDFASDSDEAAPSQRSVAAYILAQFQAFVEGGEGFPRLGLSANEVLQPGSFAAFSQTGGQVQAGQSRDVIDHVFLQSGEATFRSTMSGSGTFVFRRNGTTLQSISGSNATRSLDITFDLGDRVQLVANAASAVTIGASQIRTNDQAILPGHTSTAWNFP
jgi:hypothetical protein